MISIFSVVAFFANYIIEGTGGSRVGNTLACLIPNMAMFSGFRNISFFGLPDY